MTSELCKAVLLLLEGATPDQLRKIAAATPLTFSWLKQFLSGKMKHPSVARMETLHLHLTGSRFPK